MADILERMAGDVWILAPQGRLVLSENPSDDALKDRIVTLLQEGCTRFIVDLTNVSHVDTSGLTTLVAAHIAVRKRQGRIALVNPTKRVRELLAVTRLNAVFDVFDSEAAVFASFGVTRPSQP